jgi:hypothetical protein
MRERRFQLPCAAASPKLQNSFNLMNVEQETIFNFLFYYEHHTYHPSINPHHHRPSAKMPDTNFSSSRFFMFLLLRYTKKSISAKEKSVFMRFRGGSVISLMIR